MEDEYLEQQRFYTKEALHSFEYFKEGKEFTSNKQITAIANKIFQNSQEACIMKGSLMYSEGQKADYGYFLVQGSIALISSLSEYEIFSQKHQTHKMTQNQKKQLVANQLQIKPSHIQFNVALFCPGTVLEKRAFARLSSGSTFGLNQMLKSGVRPFTAITTSNSKIIMFHKKQFQSSLSAYELKRQDLIITPMCKQFVGTRSKQFLFSVFPYIAKKQCYFNETLYNEGDSPYAIYFIIKGQFEIYKRQKGQNESLLSLDLQNVKQIKDLQIPIRKKQQGQFIGLQEVVLKLKERKFSVRSTQSSIIYKIQAKRFKTYLDDFPQIRKGLEKYVNQTHQRNIDYSEKVFGNIQSGFKIEQSTHRQDKIKLQKTVHRQLYSGNKKRSKSRSNEIIRGYSVNMRANNAYDPEQKRGIKHNHLNHNNQEQNSPLAFNNATPDKMRSKSIDIRKSTRTIIDNNIKIDQKAYKRVMIKMGTYNSAKNNNIISSYMSKSGSGSQYKNNFQPVIDEIVRRHNTFLTKLDKQKRRQFVESKFREVVEKKSIDGTNSKESTMYKTWTVRSMKRSIKKYEQSFNIPQYTQYKKQSHNQILTRFDGIVCPSTQRQSRTSKGNREFSQQLTKRDSARSSARNKLVLVNHMMKPLVYYQNN